MKREEQRRRDLQIAIERTIGYSEATVAERYGVDPRTVRRAYKRFKEGAYKLENFDPVEVVSDTVARYDCAIDELAAMRAKAITVPQRLAVLRVQLRLMYKRMQLLMDVGIVPRSDGLKETYAELRTEYASLIYRWLRKRVYEEGQPADLDAWIREGIHDWIENGPDRLFRSEEDMIGYEPVL